MWPMPWITGVMALGAGAVIPWIAMALHQGDIETLESPLLFSVARQLESGPRGLYGPYDGTYPLVLIHAPLYYRLAALAGWPLYHVGFDSVTSALAAGRLLSALGFFTTLVAAYRLARLGGMPTRAGWWAALLVAGTPISGGFLFEVRPDMLGIGFQSTGILLVLSALVNTPIREASLTAGFAFFALAACVKQHFVVAPLVSLSLMAGMWAQGRLTLTSILRCASIATAIVVLYYGTEEWITAGRMSRSILVAAGSVGNVHPSHWYTARDTILVLVSKGVGLILLTAAAGLAMVLARPRPARFALVIASTALLGAVVVLAILQLFMVRQWISILILLGLLLVISAIIPGCALLEKSLLGGRLDATLWAYWVGELVVATVVWRLSSGAWFNYAIQGLVIACLLAARALSRAYDGAASWRPLLPAALAVLAVPAFAFTDATQVLAKREADSAAVARMLIYVQRPSTEIFFVDRPGVNRLHGRIDLVYDPWLYPVFESIGLAEPRSIWLDRALSTGPVRVVATTSSRGEIDGLNRTLPDLGYSVSKRVGPYFVWARQTRHLEK
jgi:hypothetical protein